MEWNGMINTISPSEQRSHPQRGFTIPFHSIPFLISTRNRK
jgi:hypothetical protein